MTRYRSDSIVQLVTADAARKPLMIRLDVRERAALDAYAERHGIACAAAVRYFIRTLLITNEVVPRGRKTCP